MLFKPAAHLSGSLPWSLLLPQGPHLQGGSQIHHPDSNQVLGDTETLVPLNRGGLQPRLSVPIEEWLQRLVAWLPSAGG